MPSIAGLNFRYFYATMQGFRKDRRKSTIRGRIAKGYKSSQLQRMALFFGSQPWTGRQDDVDLELAQRGRELHSENGEECHKQNGHFQDKETPPLAGHGCAEAAETRRVRELVSVTYRYGRNSQQAASRSRNASGRSSISCSDTWVAAQHFSRA